MENTTEIASNVPDIDRARRIANTVYILQAASFLVGITYFAAPLINYWKWPDVAGTWVESHFRWQVTTFWYSLLWGAVGWLTTFMFVGYLVLFATALWVAYRILVGWLSLDAGRVLKPRRQ